MNDKLYPELDEQGNKQAVELHNKFTEKLKEIADDVLSDFYCKELLHIESDSWNNYRNKIVDGLCYGGNRNGHDWERIRAKIYEENKEEIRNEVIKDLEKEIKRLNKALEYHTHN